MKSIFKTFLKYYLKVVTKIVLFIHKPVVVAVAGSTNKGFVKKQVKEKLEEAGFSVRANPIFRVVITSIKSGFQQFSRHQ